MEWYPYVGAFLSLLILGLQALLLKRQRAIGKKIEELEERITEIELEKEDYGRDDE